jgi:hypothetical protein
VSARVTVLFEGAEHDLAALTDPDFRRLAIERGTLLLDGEPMPDGQAKRVRASLLGTIAPLAIEREGERPARWIIPGLWRWGTVPMLGGPPKVGKSTLIADLCAALVIPGYRFLNHFDPVDWGEAVEGYAERNIWLINAENPPDLMHEALLATGLEYDEWTGGVPFYFHSGSRVSLVVVHLDDHGGADVFDMRDEDRRDRWAFHMMFCPCDGVTEEPPPLVVIADGVTAMLRSDTTGYGEWFAGFTDLLRELDAPNALAVGHMGMRGGHLMNGVESYAGPDGGWFLETRNPDDPKAARTFRTTGRLTAPSVDRGRVVHEDGRLSLVVAEQDADGASAATLEDEAATWDADVLDRLREAGVAGLRATDLTGSGRFGAARREAVARLQAAGRIRFVPEGQGKRWHLSDLT